MTQTKKRKEPQQLVPTQPFLFDDILVSLTGIGDMVDVRFKIDPKMCLPGGFYVIDEKSGKIGRPATMPKIGTLANKAKRKSKEGATGFGIFWNPEEVIQPGSLVTFVSGGYRREHIPVT
jgi:hypothetical protein